MCEPTILKKTGLSVSQHQRFTVYSYLSLRDLVPSANWLPVLQGWNLEDYLRHVDLYDKVDLNQLFGIICRRQGTLEILRIVKTVSKVVPRLHGFGIKISGLRLRYLESLGLDEPVEYAIYISSQNMSSLLPVCLVP